MRLHVFEYLTKRLDNVLSFIKHFHGHIIIATKMRPPPSVELELSPPLRPADLQRIVGDGIREALTPFLEALQLAGV